MDANNTRYHAFITPLDWAQCYNDLDPSSAPPTKAEVADDRTLPDGTGWYSGALTLQREVYAHTAAPNDAPPKPQDRRGAARDRYGNVYWVDAARSAIRVRWAAAKTPTHFWRAVDGVACADETDGENEAFEPSASTPAPVSMTLGGLVVTEDHYLVAGVLQPDAGVLIFDLHGGGAPQLLHWPRSATPFAPSDLSARPGQGVWILDAEHARVWALDGHWQVIALGTPPTGSAPAEGDDFMPKVSDASPPVQPLPLSPEQFVTSAAYACTGFAPFAIQGLPDCSALLLDNGSPIGAGQVRRLAIARAGATMAAMEAGLPVALRFGTHDFAFVPEHKREIAGSPPELVPDRLFVALQHGNQALSYGIGLQGGNLTLDETTDYWPMRLFAGRALIADSQMAYYDSGERWLPLVKMERTKYVRTATFYTPVLDGREPGCVWHRLLLDACLPAGTQVLVRSRATDDVKNWVQTWIDEPALYLRGDGSELPFAPDSHRDARAGSGTWELLIQQARGQFIQLQLTMEGDGRLSPQLRALRLYYPRFSYRDRYLPAIYRDPSLTDAVTAAPERPAAATFLDRFLANFEGMYTTIEDRIAMAQVLLDARSTPADALAWLADWLGVALDPAWDERTRRLFIQHAMYFFQYRGTRHGLLMALKLALDTGDCVGPVVFASSSASSTQLARYRITEKFSLRTQTTLAAIQDAAHHFVVSLPITAGGQANTDVMQRRLALARRVLDLEKPAHTDFKVQWYWALFRVGAARLGEDSLIGLGSRSPELMKPAVLGESYLVESYIAENKHE